jgi:hypothetical protein
MIRLGKMSRGQLIYARLLMVLLYPLMWGSCSLYQPPQEQHSDLGYFQFRAPDKQMQGVIIGAPEPASSEYAKWISAQTGAGFVVAYGFGSKRLSVTSPIVRSTPYTRYGNGPLAKRSVYSEFKKLLRQTAKGSIEFYVGIHFAADSADPDRIEATTSGLTFEEIEALKELFRRVRDQALARKSIAKISLAIEPLDPMSGPAAASKHHGVLMIARRGLNLRLPPALSEVSARETYGEILSSWITQVYQLTSNPWRAAQIKVRLMEYGRIESIPSRRQQKGIVVGAPHGTFDEYTAELVKQVSYRTGLAAVIAKGFTPTECGGWRINVNRPTERRYPEGDIEIDSQRAQEVYSSYKQAVAEASEGELSLYIDIHQNGRQKNIEVATTGISKEQARFIKGTYRKIRDRALKDLTGVEAVDLVIEPVDAVEIGAWAAKARGILGVAQKSLHFELPAYSVLRNSKSRDAYTGILAKLIQESADTLQSPVKKGKVVQTGLQNSRSGIDSAVSD